MTFSKWRHNQTRLAYFTFQRLVCWLTSVDIQNSSAFSQDVMTSIFLEVLRHRKTIRIVISNTKVRTKQIFIKLLSLKVV